VSGFLVLEGGRIHYGSLLAHFGGHRILFSLPVLFQARLEEKKSVLNERAV